MLVEQLGIEPSPALRDLERAILEQDPALQPAPARITSLARSPAPVLEPPAAQAVEPIAAEAPERRIVTVLFADVVDSSALFHRLDPERLERVMDRLFATASEAVARHGGIIEKYIGDAFMAVFGAPRSTRTMPRGRCARRSTCEDVAALNDEPAA